MKKENKRALFILIRYIFLFLIAVPNLYLFYLIFSPLTIYPVFFLLSLVYTAFLHGNILLVNGFSITLVDACIAGAAYYLLFLLNFSVPMPAKKRIYSLTFSIFSLLIINILRIFIFSILLVNSFRYFDITHKIFWFFLSGIFVFLIWILTIKIFKIKEIPFYNDLKFIYKLTKKK
jgi:exosortase/archaeosortase family protein